MGTAFIRKGGITASPAELGTRAGLHSQTLVSTGLADLDRILGGGLPLGSILLLLGDPFTPHCSTLLRYFVAEGVACRHRVHWASATTPNPASLPQLAKLASAAEDDGQGKEQAEDPKLRIAWQYRRYIQRQQQAASTGGRVSPAEPPALSPNTPPFLGGRASRSPPAGAGTAQPAKSGSRSGRSGMGDWCHSFDLSRPMDAACAVQPGLLECAGHRGSGALQTLVEGAHAFACQHQQPPASAAGQPPSHAAAARGPESVGRLAVEGLGASSWRLGEPEPAATAAIVRAVMHLKRLVQSSRCAAVVSVPAGEVGGSDLKRLQHLCDGVIIMEAVREDSGIARLVSDAASCCGLLRVTRLPALNALQRPAPGAELYLLRHKRRRLAIEAMQVDPDAEAAEAERTHSRPSAAGLMCAGPPAANKAMDF